GQAARGGAMALELDGDTTLELIGVTMQGNTADLHGGGLAVFGEGTLTLSASENSSWIGNVAGDNGGALSLVPTACTGCAWTAALERSVFTDNQAQDGGAVYWSNLGTQLQGSLRIEHSLLRGNSAANGGAICVDTPTPNNGAAVHLQLLESVLRDNDADNGGAAYLSRVDATIGNSVFESNASNRGGALFANLLGG